MVYKAVDVLFTAETYLVSSFCMKTRNKPELLKMTYSPKQQYQVK